MEYAAGSVILCPSCLLPLYVLERGVGGGFRAGQCASAFRPVTRAEVAALVASDRPDLPLSWRLIVRRWARTERARVVFEAARPAAGDAMVCPSCLSYWATFTDREYGSADDRAYVLHLLDIPPAQSTRRLPARARPRVTA